MVSKESLKAGIGAGFLGSLCCTTPLFIVADLTTVNDFRTTAHELGHLLDLTHEEERKFLMFKGSNGEFLSQENIDLARRNARRAYEI